MGADAFIEPIVVASILTAGVLVNQRRSPPSPVTRDGSWSPLSATSETNLLAPTTQEPQWRERRFFGKTIRTRNTARWRKSIVSRLLNKFPFLLEVWYWLLVYWTYQLGRAFTAVTLQEDNIPRARVHGLQVLDLESRLGIAWEPAIQHFFLARPSLLTFINCVYSFIHIPGTITFLAWLYYYAPAALYEKRRRTLAVCNLMAFVVFTLWPCMPPRLLPEEDGWGFVDTVHKDGVKSVWTTNKFCNQLAAMPSLHFGYSFVIGLTIATMPQTGSLKANNKLRRIALVAVGMTYPLLILVAIVATANHYILDAVAGLFVAVIGWHSNGVLCNLLPLEDWAYYVLRVHKPEREGSRRRSGASSPVGKNSQEAEEWWRQA